MIEDQFDGAINERSTRHITNQTLARREDPAGAEVLGLRRLALRMAGMLLRTGAVEMAAPA